MGRYAVKRLLQIIPVLIVASILLFVTLRVVPGDPARQILGRQATERQLEVKREELGLDQSIPEQYLDWIVGVPTGDLGVTYGSSQPVSELVREDLPVTLQLTLLALLIAILVSLPISYYSAINPGGRLDNALTAVSVIATSIPTFVWGISMVFVFSLALKLLPSSGFVPFSEDPLAWLKSMIMPSIALAMPTIGTLSRVARASMLETLEEPYIGFARSKGISRRRLLVAHALRNASVPIIAVIGAEFAYILGDAVIVETIFSIPGLGKLMIDSFLDRDYAVIQGVAVVYTILVVLSGLLADLLSAKIDPRIRLETRAA